MIRCGCRSFSSGKVPSNPSDKGSTTQPHIPQISSMPPIFRVPRGLVLPDVHFKTLISIVDDADVAESGIARAGSIQLLESVTFRCRIKVMLRRVEAKPL